MSVLTQYDWCSFFFFLTVLLYEESMLCENRDIERSWAYENGGRDWRMLPQTKEDWSYQKKLGEERIVA